MIRSAPTVSLCPSMLPWCCSNRPWSNAFITFRGPKEPSMAGLVWVRVWIPLQNALGDYAGQSLRTRTGLLPSYCRPFCFLGPPSPLVMNALDNARSRNYAHPWAVVSSTDQTPPVSTKTRGVRQDRSAHHSDGPWSLSRRHVVNTLGPSIGHYR